MGQTSKTIGKNLKKVRFSKNYDFSQFSLQQADKNAWTGKEIMERADKSQDGELDFLEAVEYLSSEGGLGDREDKEIDGVPPWFEDMDLNRDGRIQLGELDKDYYYA